MRALEGYIADGKTLRCSSVAQPLDRAMGRSEEEDRKVFSLIQTMVSRERESKKSDNFWGKYQQGETQTLTQTVSLCGDNQTANGNKHS